jgi:hypothetical protein
MKSLEERFWQKVLRTPDCWQWIASCTTHGYPQIREGNCHSRMLKAHRVCWEIHFGPIPDGMHVLHRCDNPGCVNPSHLFLGTNLDNINDCIAKNRKPKGEEIWTSKLREDQIPIIRTSGFSQQKIANIFGITQRAVSKIKLCQTWKHI